MVHPAAKQQRWLVKVVNLVWSSFFGRSEEGQEPHRRFIVYRFKCSALGCLPPFLSVSMTTLYSFPSFLLFKPIMGTDKRYVLTIFSCFVVLMSSFDYSRYSKRPSLDC